MRDMSRLRIEGTIPLVLQKTGTVSSRRIVRTSPLLVGGVLERLLQIIIY